MSNRIKFKAMNIIFKTKINVNLFLQSNYATNHICYTFELKMLNTINPLKTKQNLAEISRNELRYPLHNQKKNTRVFSFVDYNCL